MAPARPAAAAPTIAPAVFFRSDLRVSALLSAEDSTALRLDETEFLRTFGMRHLNRLVFLQDTRMRRIILQQQFSRKVVSERCRCKVRMSGLRKVGMSAFMGGRGPHGNGAHGIESTRTGPLESVAGRGAGAFNAGGSGRTDTFV